MLWTFEFGRRKNRARNELVRDFSHFRCQGLDIPAAACSFCSFLGCLHGGSFRRFSLLPFQVSFLHFLSPSVSSTNFVYNIVAILILKYLQLRSKFSWSLSNLIALLRYQLFVYRSLCAWLDNPFEGPPALAEVDIKQLALGFPK